MKEVSVQYRPYVKLSVFLTSVNRCLENQNILRRVTYRRMLGCIVIVAVSLFDIQDISGSNLGFSPGGILRRYECYLNMTHYTYVHGSCITIKLLITTV